MCKRDEETIDHLLLYCECTQVLWNAFFSRFGLTWAMPCGVARVAFFVWLAALGKILTIDNLRKKNMVLINRCEMCKRDEETIDHLLLYCECTQVLWNAFFSRFGLTWAMPCGVANLLQCWWSGAHSRSAMVWTIVPHCIMWCLWSELNMRFFDDSESSWKDLLHFFFTILFTWAVAWLAPIVITYSDFLSFFSSLPWVFSCILLVY
jgi:hypothetical protein